MSLQESGNSSRHWTNRRSRAWWRPRDFAPNVCLAFWTPAYFRLLDLPLPTGRDGIIDAFAADGLITRGEAGGWNVTNLAAALFAANIGNFGTLERKAVRVIQYRGKSRVDTLREQLGQKGYASGFAALIGYINGRLPSNEQIGEAFRTEVPVYRNWPSGSLSRMH